MRPDKPGQKSDYVDRDTENYKNVKDEYNWAEDFHTECG